MVILQSAIIKKLDPLKFFSIIKEEQIGAKALL